MAQILLVLHQKQRSSLYKYFKSTIIFYLYGILKKLMMMTNFMKISGINIINLELTI